jgi:hypothetical protein
MSWKEKVENNFTIFVLGLLVTGFAAGIGAYQFVAEVTSQSHNLSEGPGVLDWTEEARKGDWIPKNECPAYPVSSLGSGSIVDTSYTNSPYITGDLVIETSRPIPVSSHVGIVSNKSDDSNYYVSFLNFIIDQKRMIFPYNTMFKLPVYTQPGIGINLWAIVVDNRNKFGSTYASLEQITAGRTEVTLSPKVSIAVR